MKKIIFASLLTLSTITFTNNAHAAGYGPAGCGVGTMILGKDATGFMGGVAMYLNAAFYGPTSVTLGVLGCGDGGVASLNEEAQNYIAANQDVLNEEAAKGESQNLLVLADLMECSDSSSFVSEIQTTGTTFDGTLETVYHNVAQACK